MIIFRSLTGLDYCRQAKRLCRLHDRQRLHPAYIIWTVSTCCKQEKGLQTFVFSFFERTGMNAIKKSRRLIEANPATDTAKTLARLVRALESDEKFELGDLYRLDYESFALAIDVLKEWRLDRYYMGKAKLLDISVQMAGFPE